MEIEEAALIYRSTLESQATLGTGTSKVARWNALHDRNHAAYLVLRQTSEGRREIEKLLTHADPVVRLGASAHAVLWDAAMARPVLEEVAGGPGLAGFTASIVLRELDAGRLSHDW